MVSDPPLPGPYPQRWPDAAQGQREGRPPVGPGRWSGRRVPAPTPAGRPSAEIELQPLGAARDHVAALPEVRLAVGIVEAPVVVHGHLPTADGQRPRPAERYRAERRRVVAHAQPVALDR